MFFMWIHLGLMLIAILIAAQLFSNALEYFGEKIGISTGVTGSIFAATATALPETTVPLLAVLAGSSDRLINEEIGVGAILGAPFMLATLSTFIMGASIIKKRGFSGWISPERTGFCRDLNFFLGAFTCAAVAMYLPLQPMYLRYVTSVILIGIYLAYLISTFNASKTLVANGHGVEPSEPLLLTKMGFKNNSLTIAIQLLLGLVLLLASAKGFINDVEMISKTFHISALVLSLLIVPIATELPEKINSILWVRRNQDTLAFGNITGAMVFQGTLLPAIGILLTPWQPNPDVLLGIVIAFLAAAWLRLNIRESGVRIRALFINGLLYLTYLVWIINLSHS